MVAFQGAFMSFRVLLAATVTSALLAGGLHAQQATRSAASSPKGQYAALDKLPDWGGIWTLKFGPPGSRERPVLKGEYLKEYEAWRKVVETNHGVAPRVGSNCMPPGMPGIMGVGQYPIEFMFTPGRVTTHHEAWMQWRVIYTDGRTHPAPEDYDPTFAGHSIGKWEGDTLVVDTTRIKDTVPLGQGMRHSDQLHIMERIHLSKDDPDTLVVEMTIEDPQALEKPWKLTHTFTRSRDAELIEFVCAENDRNPVDESGHTQFE
jgi:hypothetical protein